MAPSRVAIVVTTLAASFLPSVMADTCSEAGSLNVNIQRSPSIPYLTEQQNYWSTGCGAMKPKCILYPKSTEEMANIVTILNNNNETFAVKSGGHNPNKGWASIAGGPLISTKDLNEVTFDRASMTVKVGPGNDWEDIHEKLQNDNVTVVGGRIGEVGVGGYVVGGGLSFLSTQYGWAANNIVEATVVLGNATVVTASNTSHPDLFMALKGGGNNFGIVTSYTMVAHPIGEIWGGNMVFPGSKSTQMLAALRNFTENYHDEKAAIIMTGELTAFGAIDMFIMFFMYDGPTPPPGVFDMFTEIGPTINNCKTRSYYDLLTANNFGVIKGSIYTITTEMMPLPSVEHSAEILGNVFGHWKNTTKEILGVAGIIGSIAFQPLPKRLAREARNRGGDLIDLDDDVDRILIEYNYSYWFNIDDNTVDQATQKIYKGTKEIIDGFQQSGKLPEAYLPLFANDAYFRQDYFARLRTADFARGVREQYDSQNFFRDRTQGWKL